MEIWVLLSKRHYSGYLTAGPACSIYVCNCLEGRCFFLFYFFKTFIISLRQLFMPLCLAARVICCGFPWAVYQTVGIKIMYLKPRPLYSFI